MKICSLILVIALGLAMAAGALTQTNYSDIDGPPHNYRQRPLRDKFTQLIQGFESGKLPLDRTSEKAFVLSLLRTLDVPVTSQMLIFSTTSLQLSLISPSNPRALYFNEDVYVGYVPGGRIEIVSLDPEVGGIYYIFDIPRDASPLRFERSDRCMNCHAGDDTGHVPGLVIKSVVPGPRGGSLTAYRLGQTGHGVPFDQRFGGWYVTGCNDITNHWGNLMGRLAEGKLTKIPNLPGERFDWNKYPVTTSDILPQLLQEHQAGFVNRVVEAAYRARTAMFISDGKLSSKQMLELDEQAKIVTRYLLFADEAPLPGKVEGNPAYKVDFLRDRRVTNGGISLKDLELQTHLLKYRCSYMIYSPVFSGLPEVMKQRIYQRLAAALSVKTPDPEFAYMPVPEKQSIRDILKATLADLPRDW